MSDRLSRLFQAQSDLQKEAYGKRPEQIIDPEERIQFIKDMILAAEDELHEALGEVGWKPWATSRHVNEGAFKGELIDLFHFFMNLCLVVGMGPRELTMGYMTKRQRNIERQLEGYDGVEGKCSHCKRAIDDIAKLLGITVDQASKTVPEGDTMRVYCLDCFDEMMIRQCEQLQHRGGDN